MDQYDTIIIGGGPAGLFCAIHCTASGHSTLLLEKKQTCGSKLLITGSGQCNITHNGDIKVFLTHYGSNSKFLKPALYSFTNRDLADYFDKRGIALITDEGGKLFPSSRCSRDILDVLMGECSRAGIEIRCNEPVIRIVKDHELFEVVTRETTFLSKVLVIATGGVSYPATGSSGDGYRFSESLGHTIRKPVPALTPVFIDSFPLSDLSGISFYGFFSVWRGRKKISGCRGDVLITHQGLSGPGILDNSRSMMPGDEIRLSFVGTLDQETFVQERSVLLRQRGRIKVASLFARYHIPARLITRLLEISGIAADQSCAHITASQRTRLIRSMTALPLKINSLGDFSVAMVTSGGVTLPEVNAKTMESQLINNLYFAGEVLDIDGDTGGYNLQAAFSTGWLAAQSIRKRQDQNQISQ